jgi:hypothetical protein
MYYDSDFAANSDNGWYTVPARRRSPQHDEMTVEEETENPPMDVGGVRSLMQQAADKISSTFPYEAVELWAQRIGKTMPDEVQLSLMKSSFPLDKNLIRHYAYLSRKEDPGLYRPFADLTAERGYEEKQMIVKDPIQIGFTLTGTVVRQSGYPNREREDAETMVAVTVDRRRITSTLCSAHPDSSWCQHVVKLVFYRIDYPFKVKYRLPVSDSVQRLSESQVRKFANLLISRRPVYMLPLAQEMLDGLLEENKGTKGVATGPVLEVPDLTAGGGIDDEGLWCLEEAEVREIIRDYCISKGGLYRCVSTNDRGKTSVASWISALKMLSKENLGMTFVNTKNADGQLFLLGEEDDDYRTRLSSRRTLKNILLVISVLIEKGERSAIAALSTVTESWLEVLNDGSNTKKGTGDLDVGESVDNLVTEGNEIKMTVIASQGLRTKNSDLLCRNGTWFLPDCLARLWRKVVFGSQLGNDEVKSLENALRTWGNRLQELVITGLIRSQIKTNECQERDRSQPFRDIYIHQNRSGIADVRLWRSLSGWNGFEHVLALFDPTVRFVYDLATIPTLEFASTPVLPEMFNRAEMLITVAYFVICLRENGMEVPAKRLALWCVKAVLSLSLEESSSAIHMETREGATIRNSPDILSAVAVCHDKVSLSLWGNQTGKGVGMALVVLFQSIEAESWAWSTKYTYNLRPWLVSLTSETSFDEIRQSSEEPVHLVVSPAVFLAVLCILTNQYRANSSALEQVELSSEKNRILSLIFETMDEQECNDFRQQFANLSPVLKQKMAFLDCTYVTLLLLQAVIPYKDYGENFSKAVFPAVATALQCQTNTQIDLFSKNCEGGSCPYQTQCAASSLVALHVYAGKEEAEVIVRSLTDSVIELFHTKEDMWTINECRNPHEALQSHRQADKLDHRKLVDYLQDMTSIVETLCPQDDAWHMSYSYTRGSMLEERLAFLKSPVAQLCSSSMHSTMYGRKEGKQVSPFVSCLKAIVKDQVSSTAHSIVLPMLLALLQIESAIDVKTDCRNRLIE